MSSHPTDFQGSVIDSLREAHTMIQAFAEVVEPAFCQCSCDGGSDARQMIEADCWTVTDQGEQGFLRQAGVDFDFKVAAVFRKNRGNVGRNPFQARKKKGALVGP